MYLNYYSLQFGDRPCHDWYYVDIVNRMLEISNGTGNGPVALQSFLQAHGVDAWIAQCRFRILATWLDGPDPNVPSSLNGNNGSATNTDDIDAANEQMANAAVFNNPPRLGAFQAQVRRARGRQHNARPVGNDHRRNNRGREQVNNNEEPAAANEQPEVQAPPEPVVVTTYVTYFVQNDLVPEVSHDGTSYVVRTNEHAFANVGTMFPSVSTNCPGFITVAYLGDDYDRTKGKPGIAVSCFERLIIEGYRRLDSNGIVRSIPPSAFTVSIPLLTFLRKNFPCAKVSKQIIDAVIATTSKQVAPSEMPVLLDVFAQTGQYFIQSIFKQETCIILSDLMTQIATNNWSTIGCDDKGLITAISRVLPVTDAFQPMRVMDIDVRFDVDYVLREDVAFRNVSDVVMDHEGRPQFENPVGLAINRWRTVYFRFTGKNQTFWESHAPTAHNLNRALKRLIGSKPDEVDLRAKAHAFGHELLGSLERNEFSAVERASMFARLQGRRVHLIPPPQALSLIEKAASRISTFISTSEGWHTLHSYVALDVAHNAARWAYYTTFLSFTTTLAPLLPRSLTAEIPHAARNLRRRYVQGSLLSGVDDLMVRRCEAGLKREISKSGQKPSRLFVKYDAGAMYANEIPDFVKVLLDGAHHYTINRVNVTIFIMSKPKNHNLSTLFTKLIESVTGSNELYFLIYSDDSVMCGNVQGCQIAANLDVSSNDSSQDYPAFFATYVAMSIFDEPRARGLVEQCLLPIRVANPHNSRSHVDLKFEGPFEGSGTTLTTILNHFGSFCIASCIAEVLTSRPIHTEEDVSRCVEYGASLCGHTVTYESCFRLGGFVPEKIQFLKYSPVHSSSGWQAVQNVGCMLRSLGSVEGDMLANQLGIPPGTFSSLSHDERMNRYTSAVVRGYVHQPNTPVLSALRERFQSDQEIEIRKDSVLDIEGYIPNVSEVCVNSWMRRYELEDWEVSQMVESILNVRVGQTYALSGFAKIYHVDYGMAYVDD
jgi:hypothetical protein